MSNGFPDQLVFVSSSVVVIYKVMSSLSASVYNAYAFTLTFLSIFVDFL